MRGIYAITNILTDTVYYGQSVRMGKRLSEHKRQLTLGGHSNPHLQASWNRYGKNAFVFAPIHPLPEGDMTAREKRCIDEAYGMGLNVFNICVASPATQLGVKRSAATLAKMSARAISQGFGMKKTAEHCARLSASAMGKRMSTEARAKMSASAMGKFISAATRAKISASLLGKVVSPETRLRLSASLAGKGLGNHNARKRVAA